jgi:hypothetical protein
MALMRWSVVILQRGKGPEYFGTMDAPDQREAYRLAIEKFEVPVERLNKLFVAKLDDKKRDH